MKRNTPIKDINKVFKESVTEVARVLGKPPIKVRRDEYCAVATEQGIPRLSKDNLVDIGGYKYALSMFFANENIEEDNIRESGDPTEYDKILYAFRDYVKENKALPSFKDFKDLNVKKYFESIKQLFNVASEIYPELKEDTFNESDFTEDYYKNVLNQIKNHKRFIITTAVSNKKVHENFFSCLKNYAKVNDALILILPCEDVVNRRSESQWVLDPKLKEALVVYKDTNINNNLFISDIKVSAKMLLPTTGLSRLAQSKGSMILASPKQFLEYIPISNEKLPLAVTTTGAITVDDYNSNDYYMSKRLSKIAENDHIVGGIVVEVEDEEIFHFRHIQYNNGKLIDLDREYYPDGTVDYTSGVICIFGDSHVAVKDDEVHETVKDIVDYINVQDIILHDIFDGECISHHTATKPMIRAMNHIHNKSDLEKEGKEVAEYLEDVGSWVDGKLVIAYSNHNTFLERYLEEGRFVKDPINGYYSLDLCKAFIEGKDPLQYMIEEKIGLSEDITVQWLKVNEDYTKYGTQLSSHGHLGPNGSKGNAKNIEKCFKRSFIAHSHTPCIYRNVFQVGTLSKLRLSYNKGPSSWIHALGILYPNGSRTLINIIRNKEGKYTWRLK